MMSVWVTVEVISFFFSDYKICGKQNCGVDDK